MSALTINTDEFTKALREYRKTTRRALPEILNQRMINIVGRAYDLLKPFPGTEEGKRAGIKTYMNEQRSQRIKLATSGKRKGKILKRGSRENQLVAANLIIQARRAKLGLKGLWGKEMTVAEGKFKQAAQIGVGSYKIPLAAIIRKLNPLVRFKSAFGRTGTVRLNTGWVARIPRWAGSEYWGKVSPAKEGWNPEVTTHMNWGNIPGTPTKVYKMTQPAFQRAYDDEAREINRHVAEKLQAEANKINAR